MCLRHAYKTYLGVSSVLFFLFLQFLFPPLVYTSKYLLNALMKGFGPSVARASCWVGPILLFCCCCCCGCFLSSSSFRWCRSFLPCFFLFFLSLVFCSAAAAARKLHFHWRNSRCSPNVFLRLPVASVYCVSFFFFFFFSLVTVLANLYIWTFFLFVVSAVCEFARVIKVPGDVWRRSSLCRWICYTLQFDYPETLNLIASGRSFLREWDNQKYEARASEDPTWFVLSLSLFLLVPLFLTKVATLLWLSWLLSTWSLFSKVKLLKIPINLFSFLYERRCLPFALIIPKLLISLLLGVLSTIPTHLKI